MSVAQDSISWTEGRGKLSVYRGTPVIGNNSLLDKRKRSKTLILEATIVFV